MSEILTNQVGPEKQFYDFLSDGKIAKSHFLDTFCSFFILQIWPINLHLGLFFNFTSLRISKELRLHTLCKL